MTQAMMAEQEPLQWYNSQPPKGGTIQLVRWFLGVGGWRSQLVTGEYLGAEAGFWLIDRGRGEERFERGPWVVCSL